MKRFVTRFSVLLMALFAVIVMVACEEPVPTSDQKQHVQQEQLNLEAVRQVGMPNITKFREKRRLKEIIELRDTADFATYTYVFSEQTGKFTKVCNSVGYGIPAATQYTNPQVLVRPYSDRDGVAMPQADPNALFSPASAEGTWVECGDPSNSKKTVAVYIEPRIITSPFPLAANIVTNP